MKRAASVMRLDVILSCRYCPFTTSLKQAGDLSRQSGLSRAAPEPPMACLLLHLPLVDARLGLNLRMQPADISRVRLSMSRMGVIE